MQIAPAVHFWYAYRRHEDDSRGDEGWRLCPAKRDRQPSFCVRVLLAAREAAVAPRAKGHKKNAPLTPLAVWVQSGYAFRIRLESSHKQNPLDWVDNYGIFKLVHNTNMRVYTFLGNFSIFGNVIDIT